MTKMNALNPSRAWHCLGGQIRCARLVKVERQQGWQSTEPFFRRRRPNLILFVCWIGIGGGVGALRWSEIGLMSNADAEAQRLRRLVVQRLESIRKSPEFRRARGCARCQPYQA
jgi:hypothetical protein